MYNLEGKTALITGGAGFLGKKHAEAIEEAGGKAILTDIINDENCLYMDVTNKDSILEVANKTDKIDILINNAAIDNKMLSKNINNNFESFDLDRWNKSLEVNLTGAFLCSQVFIKKMLDDNIKGVVLNIASDLGVIAPDNRIYENDVKPVDYCVSKSALIGLTKYLATYYADKGIRVNSISPGGVYSGQSSSIVKKLTNLIPMGRMAKKDEYKGAIKYCCSDESSYMTGHNLIIDGGRSVW